MVGGFLKEFLAPHNIWRVALKYCSLGYLKKFANFPNLSFPLIQKRRNKQKKTEVKCKRIFVYVYI